MSKYSINSDIRQSMLEHKVYSYEVAERMGLQPSNFSTMMRMELTQSQREKILGIIETIAKKKNEKNK